MTSESTSETESFATSTPPKVKQDQDDLLQRLKGLPKDQTAGAVAEVEHLSEEHEEGNKRSIRAKNRATIAKIRRYFYWFLFVLVCLCSLVLALGFLYIVGIWILSFINDYSKLESFIFQVVWASLIVMATLFVENIFRNRE